MAPESERANVCSKQMTGPNYNVGAILCNREANHEGQCSHTFQWQNFTYQRPSEPPLTCSEVVERLRNEAVEWHGQLNRETATAILHSWRERRVQELLKFVRHDEGCTWREALCSQPDCGEIHETPCNCGLEEMLGRFYSDEWREQIRKGAKHE